MLFSLSGHKFSQLMLDLTFADWQRDHSLLSFCSAYFHFTWVFFLTVFCLAILFACLPSNAFSSAEEQAPLAWHALLILDWRYSLLLVYYYYLASVIKPIIAYSKPDESLLKHSENKLFACACHVGFQCPLKHTKHFDLRCFTSGTLFPQLWQVLMHPQNCFLQNHCILGC